MGFEADWGVKIAPTGEGMPNFFRIVNRVFTACFCAELLIRLLAYRIVWFTGEDWKWNVFDALLVLSAIVQEVFESANISFIRVLRVVRVIRVARIIRVLRFFRELRRMVCAIGACLASLTWAFLLLLLIMYIFAVFFVQGAASQLKDTPETALADELREWYPSLLGTMFSLLLCISGGNDWWAICGSLVQVGEIYRFAFTFYIVFVVFGVLNVLTGVFLESATEFMDIDLVIQAQMMRDDSFLTDMTEFFSKFSMPQSQRTRIHAGEQMELINWERFQECMQEPEVRAYLSSQQLESHDAYQLFKLLDHDDQGTVSISEFITGCLRLKGEARNLDMAVVLQNQHRNAGVCEDTHDRVRSIAKRVGAKTRRHGTLGDVATV